MTRPNPSYRVDLAQTSDDLRAAQRLRYEVFVAELGGEGESVDHRARLEIDAFDAQAEHLLLRDMQRDPDDQVVGVYRLMTEDGAAQGPGFYSASEFDLSPLTGSGRSLMELGRSCLHASYRGGDAMFHLWSALARLVAERGIDLLFGVASFHGTDPDRYGAALSVLHRDHLAPPAVRVASRVPEPMNRVAAADIDRLAALRDIPALIKAYLRLGGVVGEGAFVDHAFNTIDVCLILDSQNMPDRQRRIYARGER